MKKGAGKTMFEVALSKKISEIIQHEVDQFLFGYR